MNGFSISGTGKMDGGVFGDVRIDGIGKCTGDIEAESINVDGAFKCEGNVKAGILDCDGTAKIGGNIEAKKIDVDGMLTVKNGKIEAEEIDCDGMIDAGGEVSADIIEANGFIHAKEIVGDRVSIKSRIIGLVKVFGKASTVNTIEATTIHLEGVKAETVNGRDVTIGPKCEIKAVDCNGTLYIHETAKVDSITGDYTLRK